jgi:hypothetical protein
MLCENDILRADYDILKVVSYQFPRLGTNQLLKLTNICKSCMKRFDNSPAPSTKVKSLKSNDLRLFCFGFCKRCGDNTDHGLNCLFVIIVVTFCIYCLSIYWLIIDYLQ